MATINLNDIIENKSNKTRLFKNIHQENITYNKLNYIDPFEIINHDIDTDIDEFFLKELEICLYNTPLTNKLFPKSNLYGHELIRYFDF